MLGVACCVHGLLGLPAVFCEDHASQCPATTCLPLRPVTWKLRIICVFKVPYGSRQYQTLSWLPASALLGGVAALVGRCTALVVTPWLNRLPCIRNSHASMHAWWCNAVNEWHVLHQGLTLELHVCCHICPHSCSVGR